MQEHKTDFRVTDKATGALHTEAEKHLHKFFCSLALVADNAKRDTITSDDVRVVRLVQNFA